MKIELKDLTPEQVNAYRIADNKTADLSDWNDERPSQKYTTLIRGLLYTPRMATPPEVSKLYDDAKLKKLLARIDAVQMPQDLAYFLRLTAHRFVRFRFDLIAEYYAHANEEIKQIMRELVLVIVDYNDAITAGIVKLSKELVSLINEATTSTQRSEANQWMHHEKRAH